VPLFALLAANGVSQVGKMAMMVAIPWFVLETTAAPRKQG
jgi:hypothetical protein